MSAKKAPARAKQGDTTAAVVAEIRVQEKGQFDWTEHTLSERCGLSVQHVRNILKSLTFNGTLKFQDNVIVKKTRLVLSDPASRAA